MNILAIAPHPDDESIGCGGALRKHVLAGAHVTVVFLTSGELGLKHLAKEKAWQVRETEARKAAEILGIAETIFLRGPDWMIRDSAVSEQLRPILAGKDWSTVYLPHPGEWHPDHNACLLTVRTAVPAEAKFSAVLRGYEIWTALSEYQHVEDISSVMAVKLRAIRAYQSQTAQLDYTRAALGLNAYRGAIAGRCRYAEVFQHIILDEQ
jgi:N-acetylglucosamine malate deacetylase 1